MKGQMTPLQKIAMGLVIVVLDSDAYDVLPDLFGWMLVLAGVWRFHSSYRGILRACAVGVGVASAILWFPTIRDSVEDSDPSIAWAVIDLPDLIFATLVCRALMDLAKPSDPRAVQRFGTLSVLFLVLMVIPAVAIPAESETLAGIGEVGAGVTWLWLIWSLFSHHNRGYAKPPAAAEATGGS